VGEAVGRGGTMMIGSRERSARAERTTAVSGRTAQAVGQWSVVSGQGAAVSRPVVRGQSGHSEWSGPRVRE
jgi:hypothetical protein